MPCQRACLTRIHLLPQVICAGVWHNAVLCCMCWVVALSLPWILSPGYSIGNGAVVRWACFFAAEAFNNGVSHMKNQRRHFSIDCRRLSEASPVGAYLSPGDMILSVNQCPVKGSRDWLACLTNMPALTSSRSHAANAESLLSAKSFIDQGGRPAPYTGALSTIRPLYYPQAVNVLYLELCPCAATLSACLIAIWPVLLARSHGCPGVGYCIPEEEQRGAPVCSDSTDSGLCAENELCFVERARSDHPRQLRGVSSAQFLAS